MQNLKLLPSFCAACPDKLHPTDPHSLGSPHSAQWASKPDGEGRQMAIPASGHLVYAPVSPAP